MVGEFSGRVVLITGAAGGIGRAVAARFAAAGAALVLVDRSANEDLLTAVGATQGIVVRGDLGDPASVQRVIDAANQRFGQLDVLVNVAGIMIFKAVEDHDAADWQTLMGVNLVAPALLTAHALRTMTAGGAIVNVASVHARRTSALVASYAASKAALVSLTRSTAIEGRARGIRCNAILPGAVDTAMLRASPNIKSGEEIIDPADVGTPQDIAELALFLASNRARFVNGEDLVADAGRMGKL